MRAYYCTCGGGGGGVGVLLLAMVARVCTSEFMSIAA